MTDDCDNSAYNADAWMRRNSVNAGGGSRKLLRVVNLCFFIIIFIEILLTGVQINRHGRNFGDHTTRRHQ